MTFTVKGVECICFGGRCFTAILISSMYIYSRCHNRPIETVPEENQVDEEIRGQNSIWLTQHILTIRRLIRIHLISKLTSIFKS